jgi:polyvinyl alcohol dehydrogenase (cytochrome)
MAAATSSGNDWAKYLFDASGSGFTNEATITSANAPSLAARAGWPATPGGGATISTQPVVANNLVYVGSWNGSEYALCAAACTHNKNGRGNHPSGSVWWSQNLGQTTGGTSCHPQIVGVASTPDVATVTIAGDTSPSSVLFVGGGGNNTAGGGSAQMYALDALTGRIRWRTALGASPAHFMWSSPVVYNGSVYVGVASFGDCPLVQGQLFQLAATSGAIQHVFNVVPNGCVGGGVWSSPTIDISDGSLFFATGNGGSCAVNEPYAVAVLKVRASDLAYLDSWQIPAAEQTTDSDFGAAVTLLAGTVAPGAAAVKLAGISNKNGTYYLFDRTRLNAGPVKRLLVAQPGDCPQCGKGGISPSAYDGQKLYVAAGNTAINGVACQGSLRAFDPNNLAGPLWQHCMSSGPVLGPVTAAPGIAVVGQGSYIIMVATATGATVFRGPVSSITTGSPAIFYAGASISHGVLYEADTAGNVYGYSVNGL